MEKWHLNDSLAIVSRPSLKTPQITKESLELKGEPVLPGFSSEMPVLVPQGNFPMKIYEPDSTVNYKM